MMEMTNPKDMSAEEIIDRIYRAASIVGLCERAAWEFVNGTGDPELGDNLHASLKLVSELLGRVQEALEIQEGLPEAPAGELVG